MHRLGPERPATAARARPAVPEHPAGALPAIATLHHRARVLLGLALLGAVVVLLALGAHAVVPLAVCAAAALLTYLQPPVRVTA